MIAQGQSVSRSPVPPAKIAHPERSTVGGLTQVVEIEDLGRRMVRDLEAFLSEALRPSNQPAWLSRRRVIGCKGFSCPRCQVIAAGTPSEVESC